jgi:predicted DNA-binding protein with PD1-like motif
VHHRAVPFGYIVVLQPGDELLSCLIRLARHEEIEGATVSAIGTVRDLELGFYNLGNSEAEDGYERRSFDAPMLACSITGTVSLLDGEPLPHLHGVFSRADCSTVGGHIFSATCHVTLEMAIHNAEAAFHRGPVEYCDLKLMQLEEHP